MPRAEAPRARASHAAAGGARAEGDVAVVACGAHDGVRTDAHPAVAHVGPCTGVAVVARGAVRHGRVGALAGGGVAAADRMALIGCDAEYVDATAGPALTGVVVRARIAVVARAAVGPDRVRAVAGGRVAGARVVALIRRGAGDGERAGPDSTLAGVGLGAGVAVVARGAVGLRRARAEAGRLFAGARVVALIRRVPARRSPDLAGPALTGVVVRARIAVVARAAVGPHRVRAAAGGRVVGARVVALIRRAA